MALGQADLDNVYWLPGLENPADGLGARNSCLAFLTRSRSDSIFLLSPLKAGSFSAGTLRPPRGLVSTEESAAGETHHLLFCCFCCLSLLLWFILNMCPCSIVIHLLFDGQAVRVFCATASSDTAEPEILAQCIVDLLRGPAPQGNPVIGDVLGNAALCPLVISPEEVTGLLRQYRSPERSAGTVLKKRCNLDASTP